MASLDVVLCTGANTGLGYQTIRALCGSERGYNIIIGARSLNKADDAVKSLSEEIPSTRSKLSTVQIDVEDDDSIQKAFESVKSKFGVLDVLINNAGAQFDPQLAAGRMTMRETWNKSWDVNTTGTQIVTYTFVPLLLQSSNPRLLFITSGTSTLTDHDNPALPINRPPPKGWPKNFVGLGAYRSSKSGLNMMMLEWHRLLKEDGVKVWSISPGQLATSLGAGKEANEKAGAGDPTVGGVFIKDVVEGARDADVGKVAHVSGKVQAW